MKFAPLLALLAVALACAAAWLALRRFRLRRFLLKYHGAWARAPKRRKVLIVLPTLVREDGGLVKQRRLMLPALNTAILAALTPPHWDVEIIFETIEDVPLDTDADLVAVTGMGVGLWRGLQLAAQLHARGKKVVVGGPMATLVPERVLEEGADAVCVGAAEGVWPRILADFERGALERIYRREPAEELATPVPRYDLLARKKIGWVLPVQVGRGCPHRCDFCSIAAAYHGHYHRKPIADVVRDIEAAKSLGFRDILLLDDNIVSEKGYALALFREIERLGIHWMGQCALAISTQPELLAAAAKSGCTTLSFGLESVNQESLDSVNKQFSRVEEYQRAIEAIRAAGIEVSTEMILGLDGDGAETFARTVDFIVGNRIPLPRFYMLTPVPGTPLYDRFKGAGRLLHEDFGRYNASRVVFKPDKVSVDELQRGYWDVNDRVFSLGAIFRRVFRGSARPGPLSWLFLLFVNLHYRAYVRRRICPGIV